MDYFLIFIVGFVLGANHAVYAIRRQLQNLIEEDKQLKNDDKNSSDVIPSLVLEKHGDMYYLFDKNTDAFLCQSNNITELGKNLFEYKKVKLAYVINGEANGFWFVNGKVSSKLK
jgi:hypothetical protein